MSRSIQLAIAALAGLLFSAGAPALALEAHVFRDTDGDGWLNECPGHDTDGDGLTGPADELDGNTCTGTATSGGRRLCRGEDVLDVDGDGAGETLFAAIHQASVRMIGPGDSVHVHGGTYGDVDGDGTVEQITTIPRYGCSEDQDAIATVLHCPDCSNEGDRRTLAAASHNSTRDEVIIDLGNTVATAFATRDANLATISNFHIVHQDMDTPYQDCTAAFSGTIGRRKAFELHCPGGAAGDGLQIRDNVIDQQQEVMPPGDLSKKWERGHVFMTDCGYATFDGNRFEGAVYYGMKIMYGANHHTITNNSLRIDNDTPIIYNNMAYGIYTNGNDGNIIRNNWIHRLGTDAGDVSAAFRIRAGVGPNPTLIENNVIRGFRHCAYFQDIQNLAPGGVYFQNNTCVSDGSGTYGVSALVWAGATTTIRNNIISGFESLFQDTPTQAAVGHNLVHGYDRLYRSANAGNNVSWQGGDVCHSSAACGQVNSLMDGCGGGSGCDPDPLYVGSGGLPLPWFGLQSTSPAIDAGLAASCGHQVVGSSCDMGAYEWIAPGGEPDTVQNLRRTDIYQP